MTMKYTECPECKSKNVLITQDLSGKVYDFTCITCGYNHSTPEWEKMTKEIDDAIANFDHKDLLVTKKKKI